MSEEMSGVTESVDQNPVDKIGEDQSQSMETSPVSNDDVVESETEEEKIPFGKHPRWQKMLNENRSYKQQLQDLKKIEAEYKASKDAIEFKKLLEAHPDKHEKILQLLQQKAEEQEKVSEDNLEDFSEFDPKIANALSKALKTVNEITKRTEALESIAKKYDEMSVQEQRKFEAEHTEAMTNKFNEMLKADGFIDEKGNYDEKKLRLVENDVLVELVKIAENPKLPTEKELSSAYSSAMESIRAIKTEGLRGVSVPKVPPTGSGVGTIASTYGGLKKPLSIEQMVKAFETGVVPD